MTVKQLIKKLSQLPEDAEVLLPNRCIFRDGYYAVTEVDDYSVSDGTILIDTDYKRQIE